MNEQALAQGGHVWGVDKKPAPVKRNYFKSLPKANWISFSVAIAIAIFFAVLLYKVLRPDVFKNSYIITSETFDYKSMSPLVFFLPLGIAFFSAAGILFLVKAQWIMMLSTFILLTVVFFLIASSVISPTVNKVQSQADVKAYSWVLDKTGNLPSTDEELLRTIVLNGFPGAYNIKDKDGDNWLITVDFSNKYSSGVEYKLIKLAK